MHSPSFSVNRPSASSRRSRCRAFSFRCSAAAVRALQRARQIGADRDLVACRPASGCTSRRTSRPRRRRPAACRGSCATTSIVSVDSQPCSSCAIASADITADCFWSGGYLAISRSIRASAVVAQHCVAASFIGRSSVDLAEHDVLRADDRDDVGDHVAARHLVERREVHEVGRAQLDPVRLVGAVGDRCRRRTRPSDARSRRTPRPAARACLR